MTRLRLMTPDDFAPIFDMAADYQVVQGTGSWPWPARPAFTRMRLNTPEAQAGQVLAIEVDGQFAGTIGLVRGELGYMLARWFWGRGIASLAVANMLGLGFRFGGLNTVKASVWVDNLASAGVLLKNGFEFQSRDTDFSAARGVAGPIDRYELSRASWAATAPLRIETTRLVIEPFRVDDAHEFAQQMNDAEISRMMQSIPHPFTAAMAGEWIAKRAWAGRPGFSAAIRLRTGGLIGWIGMGGSPISIAYALGRSYWGQGYATEAGAAFLAEMAVRFAPKALTAGAYADNPASVRVLEKLRFAKIGQIMDKSAARLEPAALLQYRWRKAQQPGMGGNQHEIS